MLSQAISRQQLMPMRSRLQFVSVSTVPSIIRSTIRNRARKAAPTRVTSGLVYPSDESPCRAPRGDPHDALHLARGSRLRLVGARRRRTPVPELRTDDARL